MPLPLSTIPSAPREGEGANAARESAETLALLAQRRSTKIAHFAEPGPSSAEIDAIIRLGARVPDPASARACRIMARLAHGVSWRSKAMRAPAPAKRSRP
jgi:hypothetical protein